MRLFTNFFPTCFVLPCFISGPRGATLSNFSVGKMESTLSPKVLVLGHSFVRRLAHDLKNDFDPRASETFNLQGQVHVRLHGTGGRTVQKLIKYDLGVLTEFAPDIVILEIGTNDLTVSAPEVVGSAIDDFVRFLRCSFAVKIIGVCEVLPRGTKSPHRSYFNKAVPILNNYLRVVLGEQESVFCWRHVGFCEPSCDPYLPDGVHVNSVGQYWLYRSYRGAIIKALTMLAK